MDIIIPALILSALGVSFMGHESKAEEPKVDVSANTSDISNKSSIGYNDYIRRSAEEPIFILPKVKEPYVNTTIVNNPGFRPVMDNLYFFKNYYQFNVKQYKLEKEKVIPSANINLTVDSPKIINYQDGSQINANGAMYFDGIILRAQLLPLSNQERQFRLIYEIESITSDIKKNKFAEKSSGSVLDALVDKEVFEKTKYKVIENGYNVYNERVYSIDEKIIDIDKPTYIQVGSYQIEFNLVKSKASDLYYDAQSINCKNEVCELMKRNTLEKQKK